MASLASESPGTLQALSNDLAGAIERVAPAVVAINARQRIPSSGVHWRAGTVVAANHTIKRDDDITVILHDGRTVKATLTGRDPSTDLAVLKLEDADLPIAEPADAGALRVGHLVLAVGRPGTHGVTASLGVISAVGGPFRTWGGGEIDQLVRLDLAIYDGFSGGPLVDGAGRVVGINTSGLARGMATTIPASTVNRVADQLLAKGHIARGYLGLGMQPVRLPGSLREKLKLPGDVGLIVVSVESGGPADLAGMLLGDVLVSLDGTPVGDTGDLAALLGADRIGRTVKAQIVRGGSTTDVALTVGERPRRGGGR